MDTRILVNKTVFVECKIARTNLTSRCNCIRSFIMNVCFPTCETAVKRIGG